MSLMEYLGGMIGEGVRRCHIDHHAVGTRGTMQDMASGGRPWLARAPPPPVPPPGIPP